MLYISDRVSIVRCNCRLVFASKFLRAKFRLYCYVAVHPVYKVDPTFHLVLVIVFIKDTVRAGTAVDDIERAVVTDPVTENSLY